MFRTLSFALLLTLCVLPVFAQTQDLTPEQARELAEVRANIERLGLDWKAAPNPVALKGQDYWLGMCGTPPPATDGSPVFDKSKDYPTSLDWTDNNGNWVTPPRNQGGCGSCWIFATVGGFESYKMIQSGTPGQNINYAEQFVLSCVPGVSDLGCDGGHVPDSLDFIVNNGICDEACFPYQGDDTIRCTEACDDVYDRVEFLDDWANVSCDIKGALQNGPVMTNYRVYQNFNWYSSGVYSAHGSTPTGSGHAVLIVGYDDDLQAWKVKNSWGTWWADLGGFFWVAYDSGCGFATEGYQCRDLNQAPQLANPTLDTQTLEEGESATWSIVYSDNENEAPELAALVLKAPGTDLWENKLMTSTDDDYTDGALFTITLPLTEAGTYEYFFNFANESWQVVRMPEGAEIWYGPEVTPWINTPPTLTTSELTPLTGAMGTDFTFSVVYADFDGEAPTFSQVSVNDVNSGVSTSYALTTNDDDFVAGALYTATVALDQESQYEHRFTFFNAGGQYIALPAVVDQWLPGPAVGASTAVPMTRSVILHPPAPNPANPGTNIRFSLAVDSQVDLVLFDAAGRRVRTLHSGHSAAGDVSVFWNGLDDGGRGVSSGIYFARLQVLGQNIKPMVTKVNIIR